MGRVVASFYFTAQDGTTPAGGFQCKLTLEVRGEGGLGCVRGRGTRGE